MMPVRVSDEAELHNLGMRVDPADPGRAIRATDAGTPDEEWDTDALGRYAAAELAESSRLEDEAVGIGRRSAVHLFRAGRALHLARERLKAGGEWCGWQARHGIARTSAWEAIGLFERAGDEATVAGLTISAAKAHFGVTRRAGGEEDADEPGTVAGDAALVSPGDNPCPPRPDTRAGGPAAAKNPAAPAGRNPGTRTPARARGERILADGLLEVQADGTARVTAPVFRELLAGSRPIHVSGEWGNGSRAAVARGIPCLVLPGAVAHHRSPAAGDTLPVAPDLVPGDAPGAADERVLAQLAALWRDASPSVQVEFLDRPAVRATLDRIRSKEANG